MVFHTCEECARLAAEYASATAARVRAEADLTAAAFSGDSKALKASRRAARAAMSAWKKASDAFHKHEGSHVLRAGGGPAF